MTDTVTYFLVTPRASGAVTFERRLYDKGEMVMKDTAPYFRTPFGSFTEHQARRRWAESGYQWRMLPDSQK